MNEDALLLRVLALSDELFAIELFQEVFWHVFPGLLFTRGGVVRSKPQIGGVIALAKNENRKSQLYIVFYLQSLNDECQLNIVAFIFLVGVVSSSFAFFVVLAVIKELSKRSLKLY